MGDDKKIDHFRDASEFADVESSLALEAYRLGVCDAILSMCDDPEVNFELPGILRRSVEGEIRYRKYNLGMGD